MTEGMPRLIAAEIDSYAVAIEERNLARDAAICLEQELAAAESENEKLSCAIARALGCLDSANDFEDSLPASVQRARWLLRAPLLGGES